MRGGAPMSAETVRFWLDGAERRGPAGVPVGFVLYAQGERILG